jgi:hypothetical protein
MVRGRGSEVQVSNQAVQAVLERTLVDEAFRARLFGDPSQAMAEYDLTDEEVAALCALSEDSGEGAATELDRRQSKKPLWTEFF